MMIMCLLIVRPWAAQHNAWFLMKLTPKALAVLCFAFFSALYARQTALERQDLSRMYLAHHELESVVSSL